MLSPRFLLCTFLIAPSLALPKCPLLGPNFPPPRGLGNSSYIASASSNLTNLLEDAIATSTSPFGAFSNDTSFSFEFFSTNNDDPVYTYHHSSPTLSNATSGVKKVDGNTIYRIGSLTKLFTVYLFLLKAGDTRFNDPVTEYVPELAKLSGNHDRNPIDFVDWSDVTIGELASQTSGIGRDYGLLAERFLGTFTSDQLLSFGLPPLNQSELPLCGVNASKPLCSREAFFKGFGTHHPIYAPSTTPIYSNAAFQILGYALENITGKSISSMLQDDVFKPLSLSGTFYSIPPGGSQGVIPGNESISWWDLDLGDESPAGSMYSTTSDLSKVGRAILKSAQLSPSLTRRWMKPRSFTSDGTYAVGAPWEIRLTKLDLNVVEIYTKTGNIGAYSSLLVLLPQYDAGFIVLAAGLTNSGGAVEKIADIAAQVFLPALEDAAREEANSNYAGRYLASRHSALNSSLVIQTDPAGPGLSVTQWISNGTDFSSVYGVDISLYPTGLSDPSTGRVSFRAVLNAPASSSPDQGAFEEDCVSWMGVDASQYGAVSLDDFTFVLGEDGKALSVQPRALRISLDREGSLPMSNDI